MVKVSVGYLGKICHKILLKFICQLLCSFQSKINRLCVSRYFEAPCGNAFCQHGKTSVANIFTNAECKGPTCQASCHQ